MININVENIKKLTKKGSYILVTAALGCSLLAGCGEIPKEVSTNSNTTYDVIDTLNDDALAKGITQVKEVPGELFNLVIDYKCELMSGERWTVTSDKKVNMEIRTDGLPEGVQVYIDNIHTDTTICSYFPTVDGVTQDTMDDRVHNSLMLGFPIADDNSYIGINQIEGQNDTFIRGSMHGFNGYSSGSVTEKRYIESDYLTYAVFANKITSIIDLIIVEGDRMTCVSVPSEVQISVWPYIERKTSTETTYRYYFLNPEDGKMYYQDLTEEEYYNHLESSHIKIKEK